MKTTTTSRTTIMTALVAGAGLFIAACGDDAEALSKPDFVAQANAICQETNDQINPIFETIYADTDDVEWDDPANELLLFVRWDGAMQLVVPIVDQQLADIRSLAPPSEDEELIDALLDDQEAAIDDFAGLMEAAANGDRAALEALDSSTEDPFDDINRRAREYGLTVCGEENA
jgi:hypothetical protein